MNKNFFLMYSMTTYCKQQLNVYNYSLTSLTDFSSSPDCEVYDQAVYWRICPSDR